MRCALSSIGVAYLKRRIKNSNNWHILKKFLGPLDALTFKRFNGTWPKRRIQLNFIGTYLPGNVCDLLNILNILVHQHDL